MTLYGYENGLGNGLGPCNQMMQYVFVQLSFFPPEERGHIQSSSWEYWSVADIAWVGVSAGSCAQWGITCAVSDLLQLGPAIAGTTT